MTVKLIANKEAKGRDYPECEECFLSILPLYRKEGEKA